MSMIIFLKEDLKKQDTTGDSASFWPPTPAAAPARLLQFYNEIF